MDCKKLIGKTFGDVLEDIQEYDGRVKLGSYGGSAHYWIGRASYLTTDGALEIENELHKLMLKRKKRAESALGNLAANPPSLASYVKKLAMDRAVIIFCQGFFNIIPRNAFAKFIAL